MNSKVPRFDCASLDLEAALATITGKWKLRVICLLLGGTKRFSELRRMLPGIHKGTLTYELRRLEADRIIRRTQYLTIPPTVKYTLTARGAALEFVLLALSQWSKSPSHETLNQVLKRRAAAGRI